jgi:hypothetical protein
VSHSYGRAVGAVRNAAVVAESRAFQALTGVIQTGRATAADLTYTNLTAKAVERAAKSTASADSEVAGMTAVADSVSSANCATFARFFVTVCTVPSAIKPTADCTANTVEDVTGVANYSAYGKRNGCTPYRMSNCYV